MKNHAAAAFAASLATLGSAAAAASIDDVITRLEGAYAGDGHTLYIAEIESPPLRRPLYVEIISRGEELEPLRQQVWEITESGDGFTVRVNEFPAHTDTPFATNLSGLATGMWAAPDLFPLLRPDQYEAVADLRLTTNNDTLTLTTEEPFPSNRGGAHTATLGLTAGPDGAHFQSAGVDRDGGQAWTLDLRFTEKKPLPKARRLPTGVVLIDIREGSGGPAAAEGDMFAADVIMQRTDGFIFHSTIDTPEVLAMRLDPSGIMPGIYEALLGMRAPQAPKQAAPDAGGIRKALIPASQAFGQRGNPPFVGPNQSLNVILVLESVLDKTPDEPAPN